MNFIPVVDCCNKNLEESASEILSAIWDSGFVYLKNYGVATSVQEDLFEVSRSFFALPRSTKEQFLRTRNDVDFGYISPGMETLSFKPGEAQVELREAFNVSHPFENKIWPTNVPNFRAAYERMWNEGQTLGEKLITMIAEKLGDDKVIMENHTALGTGKNSSVIRILHYPPVPPDFVEDVHRCGEHSDYGSITLLFQDEVGGLEVHNKDGQYVSATPVEGAVLVNTGDLLERWSDGAVKAVRHRVRTPPPSDPLRSKVRYSIAFFILPDDAAIVRPLNGSTRYPTSTAKEYLNEQFSKSYF